MKTFDLDSDYGDIVQNHWNKACLDAKSSDHSDDQKRDICAAETLRGQYYDAATLSPPLEDLQMYTVEEYKNFWFSGELKSISIGDYTFAVNGRVVKDNNNGDLTIAKVCRKKSPEDCTLRYFIRSKSGGSWRSTFQNAEHGGRHIEKGYDYTHLTKPNILLVRFLDESLTTPVYVDDEQSLIEHGLSLDSWHKMDKVIVYRDFQVTKNEKFSEHEVNGILMPTFLAENPDRRFFNSLTDNTKAEKALKKLLQVGWAATKMHGHAPWMKFEELKKNFETLKKEKNFLPEVTELPSSLDKIYRHLQQTKFFPDIKALPEPTYSATHMIFGGYNAYILEGILGTRKVNWVLAATESDKITNKVRVWVEKVYFADEEEKVNSFGLYPTNIGPTLMLNKPIEYIEQANNRGTIKLQDHYRNEKNEVQYVTMQSTLLDIAPFLRDFHGLLLQTEEQMEAEFIVQGGFQDPFAKKRN
jgi:hypothetical protein